MRQGIICTPTTEIIRNYESWKEVPDYLKTKNNWLKAGRKVLKSAEPKARVVYPQVVNHRGLFTPDIIVLDHYEDIATISYDQTPLYHFDQTKPYRARKRTRAYQVFEGIFFKTGRKDCWIRKTDRETGAELDDWFTEAENDYASRFNQRNRLTSKLIEQHINQRQIIGVKSTEWTCYVLIDLDYHGRDLDVFLVQAEALLSRFHGHGTWHYQVRIGEISGIQMIYVFEKPILLEKVIEEVRRQLLQLDELNPNLAARAVRAGMRSLANLEVYPTQKGNGVRLPLCRGREMLLDSPLPLLLHRKKQVQDVEGYVHWLSDPNRCYMAKERILALLHDFAESPRLPQSEGNTNVPAPVKAINRGWRGNLRRWLYQFWVEGNSNGLPLNEHIIVLCRLSASYGYSTAEIETGVKKLVRSLPEIANNCSSRLINKKYRQIDSVIRWNAKYACNDNGHQPHSEKSSDIFRAVKSRMPGFDPLDLSTWPLLLSFSMSIQTEVSWSQEQRNRLCTIFRKVLFVKNDELIMMFINSIINMTNTKAKQEQGWGKGYLLKWMTAKFPEIKCSNNKKRLSIIKCLEREGIIEVVTLGKRGRGCTKWKLGKVGMEAVRMLPDTSAVLQ